MDLILAHAEAQALMGAAAGLEAAHYHFKAEKSLLRARELYIPLMEYDGAKYNPELVQLLVLLAKVYTSERKFRQAATVLEEASALCGRDTAEIVKERAGLYGIMGANSPAIDMWGKLLSLEGVTNSDKAVGYLHAGEAAGEKGDITLATTYFEEAIKWCDPADNELSGAVFLSYGSMLGRAGENSRAKVLLLEAEKRSEVAGSYVKEGLVAVVIALYVVNDALGEKAEADSMIVKLRALEAAYSKTLLADTDPLACLTYAKMSGWLGGYYVREQDIEGAKKAVQKQVDLLQKLEIINPGSYLERLASALQDLGTIYRNNDLYKDAENCYNEAITIRRKLAEEYPDIYEPVLAKNLRSLARLYLRMKDDWQASLTMQGATTLYERLALLDPDQYEIELAECYRSLAQLIYETQSRTAAKDIWVKWLPIQERLAEKDPIKEEPKLLWVLQRLAFYYVRNNRTADAKRYFEQMLVVKERYREINPLEYDIDLANIYKELARAAKMEALRDEAEAKYLLSIAYYQRAVTASKYNRSVHIDVLKELLEMYEQTAGPGASSASLQKQLNINEQLESLEPGAYQGTIAELLTEIASVLADEGQYEAAVASRNSATDIYKKLISSYGHAFDPLLADNLFWLAILRSQHDGTDMADTTYRSCLEIYERIVREDGSDFIVKYANVLMYYGKFLQREGRDEAGKSYLEKASDIAQQCPKDEPAGILIRRS